MPPEYEVSPAQTWDKNAARRALDDLFSLARQYRSSRSYVGDGANVPEFGRFEIADGYVATRVARARNRSLN